MHLVRKYKIPQSEQHGRPPPFAGKDDEQAVPSSLRHIELPDRYEEISDQERTALIDALKAKWDSVNSKYQKITHLVLLDTAGQVRRKCDYESELTSLENDIEKLSRPGPLLMKL